VVLIRFAKEYFVVGHFRQIFAPVPGAPVAYYSPGSPKIISLRDFSPERGAVNTCTDRKNRTAGAGFQPSRSACRPAGDGSPQHDPGSPPQLHPQLSMSFPRTAALIIAHAQPTPLCTAIAWTGQFRAQAPHSMHAAGRTRSARSAPSAKTPWGQTCVHRRQLMHRSG